MITVNFWLTDEGKVRSFNRDVPAEMLTKVLNMAPDADRIGFFREALGDDRFHGHVMVWEPIP